MGKWEEWMKMEENGEGAKKSDGKFDDVVKNWNIVD